MSRRGWVLFIALSVIWGIPYLFTRLAVQEMAPPTLVFLRTVPAALLLIPLAWRRGELRPALREWRWVVAYTLFEMAIPWLLLSHAQQRITSSLAGLLVASVPLIAAVAYSRRSAGELYDWRRGVGLAVGFVGVAALVGLDLGASDPWAILEMAGVAFCFATAPFLISRRLQHLPTLGVIAATLICNGLLYAPALAFWPPGPLTGQAIGAVAVLSLVCTGAAFLVFFALVREVGPSRSTITTYINPLVAVLLGVAVLAEPFTLGIAVGMPLVLIGSALATARTRSVAPQAPPAP